MKITFNNTRDLSLIVNVCFVCFPGKLWRSVHTHHVRPAQTEDFTRVQTSSARSAVGKHQHSGRADILHTEFTLRRPGPGRLFFRGERFGTVAVWRQSTERSRQVTMNACRFLYPRRALVALKNISFFFLN